MEVTYGTWCHSRGDLLGQANTVRCQVRLGQNRYDSKSLEIQKFTKNTSDESEPSWLKPQLELNNFLLGSSQLLTFFPSVRNPKLAENELKFFFFSTLFSIFVSVAKS